MSQESFLTTPHIFLLFVVSLLVSCLVSVLIIVFVDKVYEFILSIASEIRRYFDDGNPD